MKEKKLSVLFAIVLVLALAAAGCGKKATPENLLEDVGKNLAKVESVSGDMNMSFSVSLNGETVGTGMELSLEATADPQATHMSGPVTMQMSADVRRRVPGGCGALRSRRGRRAGDLFRNERRLEPQHAGDVRGCDEYKHL